MSTIAPTGVEADLMQAILRDPYADLPRLVYADWLDEHGYPKRAEFIRVQIELANHERGNGVPAYWKAMRISHNKCQNPGCSPWCRSLQRSNELSVNAFEWFDFPPGLAPGSISWSRGFVDSVSLPMARLMGGPCERCGGFGVHEHDPGDGEMDCFHCNGSGTLPGLVDTIGSRWPVTEINLTDREPVPSHWLDSPGQVYWPNDRARTEGGLPRELWNSPQICELIVGTGERRDGVTHRAKLFPTSAAALSALSDAAVDLLRERAGLPGLKRGK